jgi:hypothetical protein
MPATAQISRIDRLCHYVESKSKTKDPHTAFEYDYQVIVYGAAGISSEDYEILTDEEISHKVQEVWDRYIIHQRCGPMGVPSTGDPLKFAIHTSFDDFIREAISLWKIDLNRIDEHGTYLDFLEERIARASGSMRGNLESYRRSLIEMGAVRAQDLPKPD